MPSYFRLQGTAQNPIGQAIPDASVAVLQQPADFTTQPGSPLQPIYSGPESNAATIVAASWSGQQITFTFSTTPPDDVVIGSYIGVSGVTPSAYDSTLQAPYLVVEVDGNDVIVTAFTDPGAYVSGGTVATSLLPNPTSTDNNGQWFAYMAAGIYSVQVYGPTIEEMDYPDQNVASSGGGVGGVTSVGLDMPAEFDVANSPITGSDTFEVTWADESANLVFAGPASGGDDTPSFRSLVAADIPSLPYVTSVALTLSVPAFLNKSVTGSPVTSTGTLALAITLANESANTVFAGPSSGSAGPPTFRSWVPEDQAIAPVTVSFSATPTFDASLSNSFSITLGGNVTSSTLSNATAGQIFVLKIIQDGTGGRTFVYPTNVKGGMLIGSAASAINTQAFWFDGTNAYALGPGAIN